MSKTQQRESSSSSPAVVPAQGAPVAKSGFQQPRGNAAMAEAFQIHSHTSGDSVVTGEMVEWLPMPPESAWNDQYGDRYARTRPRGDSAQSDFETSRRSGKVKAASAQSPKAIRVKTDISEDQLHRIILAGGESEVAARIAPMSAGVSSAFSLMMIDTAQAQADYLAHMAGETGGVLEEIEGEKRSYAPFQGRGPVQVTHPENYARALGILQQRVDQLSQEVMRISERIVVLMNERDAATDAEQKQKAIDQIDALHAQAEGIRQQILTIQDAVEAIKADPAAASDPRYAFLFSAAHMHQTGAVAGTGKLGSTAAFQGNGTADSWVSGGNKGMTFAARQVQNEQELRDIQGQLASEEDPAKRKKLQEGASKRELLIADMKSAQSRGARKERVYAAGMRILSTENAVGTPPPAP